MIVVTGGAGFIGANIVEGLNQQGFKDILVVDDLKDGHKFTNIHDLSIADYMDKSEFLKWIKFNKPFDKPLKAIIHMGACSDTTEWDGQFMMENNYSYSKTVFKEAT